MKNLRSLKKSFCTSASLLASAFLLISSSGCARVATNSNQKPSWGPIVGSSVPDQAPKQQFVVINQAQLGRGLPAVMSTGTAATTKPDSIQSTANPVLSQKAQVRSQTAGVASGEAARISGIQSEPLKAETAPATGSAASPGSGASHSQIDPFGHPAAKLALPDRLPPINEIAGEPIKDRFSLEHSPTAIPSLAKDLPSNPSLAEGPPKPIVFPNGPVQSSKPSAYPRPSESASASQQARGRLSEPSSNLPPVKLSQVRKSLELPSGDAASLSTVTNSTAAKVSDYRFSFSNEIWLMIIILGGVFATLWFRLEYDFGAKPRYRRR